MANLISNECKAIIEIQPIHSFYFSLLTCWFDFQDIYDLHVKQKFELLEL